jgi:TldD protein
MRALIITLLLSVIKSYSDAQIQKEELLPILEAELKREMSEFSKAQYPPYYLAYRVSDVHTFRYGSSFGSLTRQQSNHSRLLRTDIRVGDYQLDDSHQIEGVENKKIPNRMGERGTDLPLENVVEPITMALWSQTENAYRQALASYKEIKNELTAETTTAASVSDFSKEAPSEFVDPTTDVSTGSLYNSEEWIGRIKKYSSLFNQNPDIIDGDASLDIECEKKYFISSEGSRIIENRRYAYLTIGGSIRADDGDIVPLHKSFYAINASQLPSDEVILAEVSKMIGKLVALKTAPVADPYTGPAILSAHVSGVFFHEIFGHRVEGHRLKDNADGQTFKGKINELVLPKTMSVIFDPTLNDYHGQPLNGSYLYDDEGVKGKKVVVVEKGILKTFLMSRTPIGGISNSNGHGRAQAGSRSVSRQSNLIVENSKTVSMNDLRKMLRSACQKQKKPYGYFFADVVGGFTTTDRYRPNAFNIFPTEVYRVYVDGRPDELVRGVDLIGTPLAMFAEVQASDNKSEVFTGFCGAESGSIPVTAIAPALFVKRIETQKKPGSQIEKNILARPSGQ